MTRLFVFGLGYTGGRLAETLRARGWLIAGTGRAGLRFDDSPSVLPALAAATHIVSTIPPGANGDPVLNAYRNALDGRWLGYLSSTGVYGDAGGAWVDETTPIAGRRLDRNSADADWLGLGARVFRLPGIYGPGRSALDRLRDGKAHRIDLPGQVFSRIHVDDIVSGVIAGFDAPAGAYNLSDDFPCDQNQVIEQAAALLDVEPPAFATLESLSPMARAFYAENRRIANGKAKRTLGWSPRFPDFRAGLRTLARDDASLCAERHEQADQRDRAADR